MAQLVDESGTTVFTGTIKNGGSQPARSVAVPITSAEILALADTPKVIVPGVPGVTVVPLVVAFTPGPGAPYVADSSPFLYSGVSAAASTFTWGSITPFAYWLANSISVVKGVNVVNDMFWASDAPVPSPAGMPLILQVEDGGISPTDGTFDAVLGVTYVTI